MAIIHPPSSLYEETRCMNRRNELVAGIHSLSERELRDIGLWRGAIPETVERLLAGDGCEPEKAEK